MAFFFHLHRENEKLSSILPTFRTLQEKFSFYPLVSLRFPGRWKRNLKKKLKGSRVRNRIKSRSGIITLMLIYVHWGQKTLWNVNDVDYSERMKKLWNLFENSRKQKPFSESGCLWVSSYSEDKQGCKVYVFNEFVHKLKYIFGNQDG